MAKHREDGSQLARFIPPKEWTEAFNMQCTEQMRRRARRFAAQRPGSSAYDADELVQGVIFDTLRGLLRWDPTVRKLDVHLFAAIRRRAIRAVARAEQLPHVSIDVVDDDGESSVMDETDALLLAEGPVATPETVARAAEISFALKQLAAGKAPVVRLLDAFASGAITRNDVMRTARMTHAEYHNARRKLARLVEQLPDELKPCRLARRSA
jgi:hypothetical protein